MDLRVVALQWFVALSLVAGGLLLLVEARLFRDPVAGKEFLLVAVGAWSSFLASFTYLGVRRVVPWPAVSSVLLGSVMTAIAWAHFDVAGHLVLSGLAPVVAIFAGAGIVRSQRWAWPVALAIAAGIGPLFLTFAPLPDVAYVGASGLFLADVLALLLLTESFFPPASGGP